MSIVATHFENLVKIRDNGGDINEYVVSRIAIGDLRAVAEYGRTKDGFHTLEWYERKKRDIRIEAALANALFS
jgi:hypothetical protein